MLSIKHLSGGGDYVEPHVVLIEDTYSVNYKVAPPPAGKAVNLITLRPFVMVDELYADFSCTYEMPCDVYINVNTDGMFGDSVFSMNKGDQNGTRTSIDMGGSTMVVKGIGFTVEEANSGQMECEDDMYIYRAIVE